MVKLMQLKDRSQMLSKKSVAATCVHAYMWYTSTARVSHAQQRAQYRSRLGHTLSLAFDSTGIDPAARVSSAFAPQQSHCRPGTRHRISRHLRMPSGVRNHARACSRTPGGHTSCARCIISALGFCATSSLSCAGEDLSSNCFIKSSTVFSMFFSSCKTVKTR